MDSGWEKGYCKDEWDGHKKMNIKKLENQYFMHIYKRNNLVVKKAKDQFVWDNKGKKYLDFFSGIGVCNMGHCNDSIVNAIKSQLDLYMHTSNLYYSPVQIKLGQELAKKISPNAKVFLANSGAEANECAIKLARKWGILNPSKSGNRYEIICFDNSFHGRTMATTAASGQKKLHQYLTPLQEKFVFAKFNDIESVKKLISSKTVAVMVEPIQGEGGVFPASKKFIKELRAVCSKNNILLIFDEVQCGVGRTGKFFAFKNYDVEPDIVTLAKALANGLPLGAVIAIDKCVDTFSYGDHGSTFGGNPVSCAAARAVLKIINSKTLNSSVRVSKYLFSKLQQLKSKHPRIREIRGMGLMVGIDLSISGKLIVEYCLSKGLIINCTQETVLRLLPSLVISRQDVDVAIDIIDKGLAKFT